MSKPDGIPQDIWEAAQQTESDCINATWNGSAKGSRLISEEIIARAILAERKRCAQILLTQHENHPQDGVNWDGTYYDLYEQILGVPR